MPFRPGDVARAKAGTWHDSYANCLFLVLEVVKEDVDPVTQDVMGVSGDKYILLDHISGGKLHAYDSELEELE